MKISSKTIRSGFVKYVVLGVLATGGFAAGLYYSQSTTPTPTPQPIETLTTIEKPNRYSLTSADAKDTLEAPVLATDTQGRVYLAWASKTGDEERTLFLSRSEDAGKTFDTPKIVAKSGIFKAVAMMKGKTITRELRMVPHLATTGNTVQLAWTETLPENAGVRLVTAASSNRGDSFSAPVPVHQGAGARATFTAITAAPNGTLIGSWLDNRNKAQQCYAAIRKPGQANFEPEEVVHSGDDSKGVCPCCPTANLLGPDGKIYVAFRNIANGYRDISIGVKKPGESTFELHSVVPPTWTFNGCPHDGPSLACVGDTLHVTWMDAHSGSSRCYHASAKLSDMKFTARELHAIPTGTQGNAKIHVDSKGNLHAVWEESLGAEAPAEAGHKHEPQAPTVGSGGGRAIMVRSIPAGSTDFTEAQAVASKPGAFQTRPSLTSTPQGELVIAWNELDETGKAVVVTRLNPAKGK